MNTKDQSPAYRRYLIWIIFTVLVVLLILGEIAIQKLKNNGWLTYTSTNSGLVHNSVNSVAFDEQDRVWLGTYKGLSVLAPDGSWTSYTTENSSFGTSYNPLSDSDNVSSVAIDIQGRIWVGTHYYSGLSMLSPDGSWTTYTPNNSGLGDDSVSAVAVDGQGWVWVGTKSDGLNVLYPDGSWTRYTTANSGLIGDYVSAVDIDKQGRVWMGTYEGLSVLAPDGNWTSYTPANSGLVGDRVTSVAVDKQGQVWVGTKYKGGLSVLSPDGSWTTYTPANSGLASDGILAVAVDGQEQVWVGTYEGLSVLSPDGSWTNYTPTNSGLADSYVKPVTIDKQGRVWVGASSGGLSVLYPGDVTNPGLINTLLDLRLFIIFALMILAIVWVVQRWRSRPKKVIVLEPAVQHTFAADLAAVLETNSTLEDQEQRQQKVARLIEIFRKGDQAQRQQALEELKSMGEVEEF